MARFHFVWLALFLPVCASYAAERSFYADPIALASYVTDPRALIKTGMDRFQWLVDSEEPGKIVAKLEHDKHKLLVAISYDSHSIRFADISTEAFGCVATSGHSQSSSTPAKCAIDKDDVERWRVSLRRGILKAVHTVALADAVANYNALPPEKRKVAQPKVEEPDTDEPGDDTDDEPEPAP